VSVLVLAAAIIGASNDVGNGGAGVGVCFGGCDILLTVSAMVE